MSRSTSCFYILTICFLASCGNRQQPQSNIDKAEIPGRLHENDVKLARPKPGEWLYNHREPGQTFEEYKSSEPVRPDSIRKTIYLLPLGRFSRSQLELIRYTTAYLQLYFGLPAKILPVESDQIIPASARRTRSDKSSQLLTTYILDSVLKERIPQDAIALMAVTEKDLYPNPSWNFVFGQASLKERVGVSSIYRYSSQPLDSKNYQICLGRLISTSSHEIGHMLSMHHCIDAVCVMNGSNSLAESDTRPNRLCSFCLKKLQWNTGVDIKKRLESLDNFFNHHRLTKDYEANHADLRLIQ